MRSRQSMTGDGHGSQPLLVQHGRVIQAFGTLRLLPTALSHIDSLTPLAAVGLFIAYATLNGLTLSAIFLVYISTSIAQAFLATAATFGVMSLYGSTIKTLFVDGRQSVGDGPDWLLDRLSRQPVLGELRIVACRDS